MNKIQLFKVIGLLAFISGGLAQADMIVDTGAPSQTSPELMLSNAQWLASEFTVKQATQLNSLAGFINADTGNPDNATFTIAVYSGSLSADNEVFAQQSTYLADGWNGLQGLSLNVGLGNYWLAFEVRENDNLQGLMPVIAPKTLATAFNDATTNFGYQSISANYNLAVQVSAVPLPPAIVAFASGLVVFLAGRRNLSTL